MTADSELARNPPRPTLTTVKGDVEKAQDYKKRLAELLQPVCDLVTEAKRDGIILNYQCMNDATGRQFVSSLSALKEL